MKARISTPRRILILQTAFVGDVMLTLPLLQTVKKLFPNAALDFLAIPAARNILETHPDIHQLIIYDKRKRDKGIIPFFRLIRRLRENRYDLAIVPHRSIRSVALVWAARIPLRIGFDRSAGRFLLNRIIPYRTGIHEINRNLHLLDPFGIAADEKVLPKLFFSDEDEQAVFEWMKRRQLNQLENLVALAPGSVWATKRWLPEYFARLAKMLKEAGFQIVLIGGEADVEVARQVEQAISSPVFNAVGKFTIRQSAFLIRQARLLVTNDSAPQHLAAAVGTPVVAIFGPTVPAFGFYPYGERDRVVEIGELPCRPCSIHGGQKCPISTFECMKKLTPERVFGEAQQILKG
ncbi:MAG: lipopolysaccharide heptosyltransferase II [Calditrichaceae bacterium]|nr:lipopolysaccharide heptosyltransferase II [Calditrichia bacterium]NUQ43473.1 lipopolysaccharide heptosyltransferase II [Calditrichaceae bacterium]